MARRQMTPVEFAGHLGRVLGDGAVMATAVLLWEFLGVVGVLAYFTLRTAVFAARVASR